MRTCARFVEIRIRQPSPDYMITRRLFITKGVANDPNGLSANTGPSAPNLMFCYVEVYGNFRVDGGPPEPLQATPSPQTALHHGQMVFDGVTGNLLVMGVTV